MGAFYPVGQYYRNSQRCLYHCTGMNKACRSVHSLLRRLPVRDLLLQLAAQLEQAQPWFGQYAKIRI